MEAPLYTQFLRFVHGNHFFKRIYQGERQTTKSGNDIQPVDSACPGEDIAENRAEKKDHKGQYIGEKKSLYPDMAIDPQGNTFSRFRIEIVSDCQHHARATGFAETQFAHTATLARFPLSIMTRAIPFSVLITVPVSIT
jgi:hypothetical protein